MSLSKQKAKSELNPIVNLCDKGLRQYPHRYPVPRFTTTMPFKRNPISITHEHRLREWVDWLYPCSQLSRRKYLKFETSTLLISYFFSAPVPERRYANLIKMMTTFFILDDHTDNPWGDVGRQVDRGRHVWTQFSRMFDEIAGAEDVLMDDWVSYVVGVYPVFKTVYKSFDADQRRRYVYEWQSYAEGCQLENDALLCHHNGQPIGLESYIKIREKSVGFRPCVQLFEYAYNFRIPNHIWDNPDVQKLINACNVHCIYTNDIFSFEKEVLEEGADHLNMVFNSVAITAMNDHCTVVEAMDRIVAKIMSLESAIMIMMDKLVMPSADTAPGDILVLEQFVYYMRYLCGGQYRMSTVWDRYHRFNKYPA